MERTVRYGSIDFDPEFYSATDQRGGPIKFSRAERLLLAKFSESPHVVLSRERLLDVVSGAGSDAVDRNIDYTINRLRRKLRDSARNPRYIETRYGEGYVWIAERIRTTAQSSGAFLVIGPLMGLGHCGRYASLARLSARILQSHLNSKMTASRRVVVDEDCPSADLFTGEKPAFAAELCFLDTSGGLDCAATIRVFGTGQIIKVLRCTVAHANAGEPLLNTKQIAAAAEEVAAAIWDHLAYPQSHIAPSEDALPIRMHAAAELLTRNEPWREADRRLRSQLEADGADFRAKLMLATNLHSKYLMSGLILPETDHRARDEDEMEALVLSSLPHLQENPIFMLAAAKLLYFLDRGHRLLAVKIAEQAFGATTAYAASFAAFGQMRMFMGELENATALFDRGLELVEVGSHFDRYLLTLKCQALLAAGERAALLASFDTLCQRAPGIRAQLSIFFSPSEPGQILPEAQTIADSVDERRARAMLLWVDYICGRLFQSAEHRLNVVGPSTRLFARRFGQGVVPEEVIRAIPALLGDRSAQGRKRPVKSAGAAWATRTAALGEI
ncbi:MAG TPA: helix-turn-helix domain-containing protein [Devosiaceae bacterium]|jgi:DNA-binding winged helix-turn-helix (wHTH) protein|nr:helix-turn-helix domain-containing protein [Devosiaceae bacterium]